MSQNKISDHMKSKLAFKISQLFITYLVLIKITMLLRVILSLSVLLLAYTSATPLRPRSPVSLSPVTEGVKSFLHDAHGVKERSWPFAITDHFNIGEGEKEWEMRYLISEKYSKAGGPVFFYCGNEGDIYTFANNALMIYDWADRFGATVGMSGKSWPCPKEECFKQPYIGLLTAEQALADYVQFIDGMFHGKRPVIAFGGSYGGMLAAWARMKYPSVFAGAIAASAPILQFPDMVNPATFNEIITNDFRKAGGEECVQTLSTVYASLLTDSPTLISQKLKLCTVFEESERRTMIDFVQTAHTYMAMTDYPTETDFLRPMPAWPVTEACRTMAESKGDVYDKFAASVGVFYNYTGDQTCYDINEGISPGLGSGWDVQACTEMIMPIDSSVKSPSADGAIRDIFPQVPWSLKDLTAMCQKEFGLTPRPQWVRLQFGGLDLAPYTNIVYSVGTLDPWTAGCPLSSPNDSSPLVVIEDGAHHLDLRAPSENDPPSVRQARIVEARAINDWIAAWHSQH